MRKINKLVYHCSDSKWGSAGEIDKWHKELGWNEIGYQYVICNGRPNYEDGQMTYQEWFDGHVQIGRNVEKMGAHVRGHNRDSIGICLIGRDNFTDKQFESLAILTKMLMDKYNIIMENIYGHNEFDKNKACPTFSVDWFLDTYVSII